MRIRAFPVSNFSLINLISYQRQCTRINVLELKVLQSRQSKLDLVQFRNFKFQKFSSINFGRNVVGRT